MLMILWSSFPAWSSVKYDTYELGTDSFEARTSQISELTSVGRILSETATVNAPEPSCLARGTTSEHSHFQPGQRRNAQFHAASLDVSSPITDSAWAQGVSHRRQCSASDRIPVGRVDQS